MKSVKRYGPHHLNIKSSSTHAFNYIMLRVNPGLTSFEDLATALIMIKSTQHATFKIAVEYTGLRYWNKQFP